MRYLPASVNLKPPYLVPLCSQCLVRVDKRLHMNPWRYLTAINLNLCKPWIYQWRLGISCFTVHYLRVPQGLHAMICDTCFIRNHLMFNLDIYLWEYLDIKRQDVLWDLFCRKLVSFLVYLYLWWTMASSSSNGSTSFVFQIILEWGQNVYFMVVVRNKLNQNLLSMRQFLVQSNWNLQNLNRYSFVCCKLVHRSILFHIHDYKFSLVHQLDTII